MPKDKSGRLAMSDAARSRAVASVLWVLVIVSAAGGVTALVGPNPGVADRNEPTPSPVVVSEVVAAAGFGERFVAAYLTADADAGSELAAFLGYTPELPLGGEPASPAGTVVRAVEVEPVGEGYWVVTAAAGESGGEAFWRVGVLDRRGRLVAVGLPTPAAAPSGGDEPELAVGLSAVPPADDPMVETVAGWVAAYACGRGDAFRYLAPGAALAAVTPPVCRDARLERWGASDPDGQGRVVVVTEAVLSSGLVERRVSFALRLARRGGRWEIGELLGAPPLADEVDGRHEEEVAGS